MIFKFFARLKLGVKFTLLLAVVFLAGLLVMGSVLMTAFQQKAERDVATTALMLMETMSAIRSYTSDHIQPLLGGAQAQSETFIAEAVPAFSARAVFDKVRSQPAYATFFYKEATLNPTNRNDLADAYETDLVNRFRADTSLREITGFRTTDVGQRFFIARPLMVTSESCLVCHSTPANAPASLVRAYGDQNGFGWQLNEIIAAQTIYVPADEVYNNASRSFFSVVSVFAGVFAVAMLLIHFLVGRYVGLPVKVLGHVANRLAADSLTGEQLRAGELEKIAARQDELGHLAKLFRRMAQDVIGREKDLRKRVADLNIQIDEMKKANQVKAVVDSEFFQDLQSRAGELRRRKVNQTKSMTKVSTNQTPPA
jgi:methyl-accepting chemotaxis protein